MKTQEPSVKDHVDAGTLLSALGKFHHISLVWPAGRPCLYALWKLYYTAHFKFGDPSKLIPKKQELEVTSEARRAILHWWEEVSLRTIPIRRMICCTALKNYATLDILRVKQYPSTQRPIWIRLANPVCSWERPEVLMGDYGEDSTAKDKERIAVWLEALLEGLELMIVRPTVEVVLIRTNLRKLAEALRKDLYVKSSTGTLIAQKIHDLLEKMGESHPSSSNGARTSPLEIRAVLVYGGTPHPRD